MAGTLDMDRYEKRARELMKMMNDDITAGKMIAGTPQYEDMAWLVRTLLKASKTYKKD